MVYKLRKNKKSFSSIPKASGLVKFLHNTDDCSETAVYIS